ncbi:ParA family protein [Hyphomicrobium sp.]|jgi:cellulose biosynthesis protein BcsQ|uniref:ParA family protein n=1 Tax=Hyphomicrobium sp. TaxID=82 RepID=UPI003567AB36
MPQTIAFVSQTGNVMKTTIATAMGITLAAAGLKVLAVDFDSEHRDRGASIATWLEERRARHPDRPQLEVLTPRTAQEGLDGINRADIDIALLDCPSRATQASFLLAAGADFTILPQPPGAKDAILTLSTLHQMIAAGIQPERLAVILARTGSDAEAADYINWLHSANVGPINIISQHIPERPSYRNALARHLAITEAQPVSVRVQARRAIDALIEAFDYATTRTDIRPPAHYLQGAA